MEKHEIVKWTKFRVVWFEEDLVQKDEISEKEILDLLSNEQAESNSFDFPYIENVPDLRGSNDLCKNLVELVAMGLLSNLDPRTDFRAIIQKLNNKGAFENFSEFSRSF